MAIFSLEDGTKYLQDARKASYSLEAATPQCKGEENNPTPSYTTLHHTTQREATGEWREECCHAQSEIFKLFWQF